MVGRIEVPFSGVLSVAASCPRSCSPMRLRNSLQGLPSALLVLMILGLLHVSLLGFGSTPDVHHEQEVSFSVTCSIQEHLAGEVHEPLR